MKTTKKTLGFLVTVNGAIAATIIKPDLTEARAEAQKTADVLIIAAKKGQTITDRTEIEIKRWCAGDGLNGHSGTVAAWEVRENGAAYEWNGEFLQTYHPTR